MAEPEVVVRRLGPADADWAEATQVDTWGAIHVARRGELIDPTRLPGFVAIVAGAHVGVAHVAVRGAECEIVTISTSLPRHGVGSALMRACIDEASAAGCRRVWLTTTNNNIAAIAFYQRIGMDLCAFYRDAVASARELKPSIPVRDADGVPIAHELEFELILPARALG